MSPRSIGSYQWGYSQGDPAITLAAQNYSILNIWDIPDVPADWNTTVSLNTDDVIRDETSSGDSQGFKVYPSDDFRSRIGFAATDKLLGNYPEGSMIPVGLAETLKIIAHRNKILLDENIHLPVPVASNGESEANNLASCMLLAASNQAALSRLYWPAASAAYAYEPALKRGEVMHEKFALHKWFLPAPGDGLRLSWLAKQNGVDGSAFDIWAKAILYGLCSAAPVAMHTTGEYVGGDAMYVSMVVDVSKGFWTGRNTSDGDFSRQTSYPVYPMVQF